jgi:hypothetical protein
MTHKLNGFGSAEAETTSPPKNKASAEDNIATERAGDRMFPLPF